MIQSYEISEHNLYRDETEDDQKSRVSSLCELKTNRKVVPLGVIDFEERKPGSLVPFTEKGELVISFTFFNEDEVRVLKEFNLIFKAELKIWEKSHKEDTSKTLTKEFIPETDEPICFRSTFIASTAYCLKMRIAHKGMSTQWSDEAEFTIPEFKNLCFWKECPDNVVKDLKYSVDANNLVVVTNISGYDYCTVIGNTPLPLNKVTSWSIKILRSKGNNGKYIMLELHHLT